MGDGTSGGAGTTSVGIIVAVDEVIAQPTRRALGANPTASQGLMTKGETSVYDGDDGRLPTGGGHGPATGRANAR